MSSRAVIHEVVIPKVSDESPQEERIGKYRVHPVASMFPLLEGKEYDDLSDSIEANGQQKPIIVQDSVLLDGRNRLKVCLALDIEPKVEQYTGSLKPVEYILVANVDRRHLTPEERLAILCKVHAWNVEQGNAAKKAAQGQHGAEGGRGKKKTLNTNSYSGFSERDTAAMNANSTVGQLAEQAKVSHHKAAQAVAVGKAAPDLLDQVAKGDLKLKDAYAKVRAAAPKKPRKPRAIPPEYLQIDKGDPVRAAAAIRKRCSEEFVNALMEALVRRGGAYVGWTPQDVAVFLRNLRLAIAKTRTANKIEHTRRQWNTDAVLKHELIKLIDFIESELDKVPYE
jgi:hypothetical protein